MLLTHMLQKCNFQRYLMIGSLVVIVGCVSQGRSGEIVTANSTDASQISKQENQSDDEKENLNTKTIVPVGFEKFMGIFTPYRITIQQGNFVSKEMAAQVKVGMTREQVRFLLGTALLTDMFHADRWDYIFRLLKPNGELTTSRVTVYFDKNLVNKIESGDLPSEQEYLAKITDAEITNN